MKNFTSLVVFINASGLLEFYEVCGNGDSV